MLKPNMTNMKVHSKKLEFYLEGNRGPVKGFKLDSVHIYLL